MPALQNGSIVITDRCADSSLAYQGYGLGIDKSMIRSVNTWAMNGIDPDLVFYLDLDLETAQARIARERAKLTVFEQRGKEFWERVMHGYEEIFASREEACTLDGGDNINGVFAQAKQCFKKVLAQQSGCVAHDICKQLCEKL